jgi:nucleoside 2-deoxyribosyltransferase
LVYLAGPTVFAPDPALVFDRMKTICSDHGLTGVAPLDNQVDLSGVTPGKGLCERIVRADIDLMRRVDAGVFCLDGFRRGPEMDPGTAFEIGFMAALGKPMAGWTRDPLLYPRRVETYFHDVFGEGLVATPAGAVGATSGAARDPDGVLVHSEGCVQNAMVHIGIEMSGGVVAADPDWEAAFTAAISALKRLLGG